MEYSGTSAFSHADLLLVRRKTNGHSNSSMCYVEFLPARIFPVCSFPPFGMSQTEGFPGPIHLGRIETVRGLTFPSSHRENSLPKNGKRDAPNSFCPGISCIGRRKEKWNKDQ